MAPNIEWSGTALPQKTINCLIVAIVDASITELIFKRFLAALADAFSESLAHESKKLITSLARKKNL